MKKDGHLHPFVLMRPGMLDRFIQRAITLGFDEICITDHMPIPGCSVPDRIPDGALRQYTETIREAAERYQGRISVRCGIEIDHAANLDEVIRRHLAECDFDSILGSTHPNMMQPPPLHLAQTRREYAALLLKNALDAASSGRYHVLTHIDIYRRLFVKTGSQAFPMPPDDFHPREQEGLLREMFHVMREQGMRLEINASLNPANRRPEEVHPDPWILLLAQETGVHFSYGSDAHAEADVGLLYEELKRTPPYDEAMLDWEA